jgi:hypothetical protein
LQVVVVQVPWVVVVVQVVTAHRLELLVAVPRRKQSWLYLQPPITQ